MVNMKEYVMGKLLKQGFFKNGKKDGEWITYNKKGAMIRKINYLDGQLNGKCEVFSSNGTPKLYASFNLGEKSGKWTYFTSNGKIFITGEFESGKPINTWTINDKRGKAPVIQYDYNAKKYLMNQPLGLYKDNDIIQNDNTKEYYILRYPDRPIGYGTLPIGGLTLSSDLFVELMEVPLDYWDTYTNYKYKATFNTSIEHKTSISVETIPNHMADEVPTFPFIIKTNDDFKLKRVNQTELSKQLLDFKIEETLNLLPPWVYADKHETEVYVPYVINQIVEY